MSNPNYFSNALYDFVSDVASGDAIRHLADKGFTVREIVERLSFPTPVEKVRKVVWQHYIDTGVIRLTEPNNEPLTRVAYVKESNQYGKSSFRRVVEKVSNSKELEYVTCDYGKEMYKDKERFVGQLECLDACDREYILELPWPLERVWHVRDERMERILKVGINE